MRAALASLAASALCLSAPAAQAAPTDARLDAFKAACLPDHRQPAKRPAVFEREGWTPVADADHAMLAEVMALSRAQATESEAEGVAWALSTWRRQEGEATFHLVLATLRGETVAFTGCYLYDFASVAPVDPALVTAWLGEEPAQTVGRAGITAQIWNARAIPGATEVQAAIVAPGSQAAKIVGFHGVTIKLSSDVESAPAAPGAGT